MSSLILDFIKKHPNDWEELFSIEYQFIMVKECEENPNYRIFNYLIGSDFSDPIVQEARGIIIDVSVPEVVCFPFRKFGKYYEPYADKIDWSTAKVQEKLDGSIVKLWFDKYQNDWVWSTNGMIYAKDARIDNDSSMSFLDLIKSASNYGIIEDLLYQPNFPKYKTYIFELTSPYNQVVVKYETITLYHIGTRSNLTGIEEDVDLGIIKPNTYKLSSIEDCIKFLDTGKNANAKYQLSNCSLEGFVVVDANYNRVKVKSSIYVILHNIVTGSEVSKDTLVKLTLENKIDITKLCEYFPNLAHVLSYYFYKVKEFDRELRAIVDISRKLYIEFNDRKRIANLVKTSIYSPYIFKSLNNTLDVSEIPMTKPYYKFVSSHIQTYQSTNFSYMFDEFYRE